MRCPTRARQVLGRMNFESPYVDMPMRLTVRQNLTVFGKLYAVPDLRARIDRARRRSRSRRVSRPAERQALGRAEDPGGAGQGADQPARSAAARRADRLARSGYRRLGAAAAGDLPAAARRHHPARLAQHARGRATVRPRDHHEARPDRGRRYAVRHHGALQPLDAGGRVPRRRARPGAGGENRERRGLASRTRGAPDRRDDPALLVSVDVVLAAAAGAGLLAGAADDHLGLPAELHRAEFRLLRAGRRHADRRGDPVGHHVSRPARLLDLVSGGDVGAQPRQSDDEPAEADRISARADDDEPDPARDRRRADAGAGDVLLQFQPVRAWGCRWWRSSAT